jgi:hypothetical protein
MVALVKPTTKNSPKVVTGKNRDNKPAEAYAGRAKEAFVQLADRPNRSKADTLDMSVGAISKSAGDEPIKTTGIKMRGTGAATKGLMSQRPNGLILWH